MKRLLTTITLALLLIIGMGGGDETAQAAEFDIGTGIVMQSGAKPSLGIISALDVNLMDNGKGWTFKFEPSYLYVNGENDEEMQILRGFMMIDKSFSLDSTKFWSHLKLGGGFGGWSIVQEGNDDEHRGFQIRLLAHLFVADFKFACDIINVAEGPDIYMPYLGMKIVGM